MTHAQTLIIGAGPAGLTAAYELAKAGRTVTVVERDPHYVGGISRTVVYKDYRFDIGGHRFFSKSREIEDLWTEILGDELLQRPRSSRIYYNGKLFDYPLRAMDALVKLGPVEAARCVLSYLKARAFPNDPVDNFEQWVVNNFGRRLFEIFFKTYTEKVWGMDCSEISADWAAQRIKGLNLYQAIMSSLAPAGKRGKKDGEVIKTLIDSFRYPRLGPGQMWERTRDLIRERGGQVLMGSTLSKIAQDPATGRWSAMITGQDGQQTPMTAENLVSTTAINELVGMLGVSADPEFAEPSAGLRYRDFLIVALIARGRERFSDNWIYVHDKKVQVGRIQNFKSWSPHMVPDPDSVCYGLEYFCNDDEDIWSRPDAELIDLAKREIGTLGLIAPEAVVDGAVVRQPKAYPVYDEDYQFNVSRIREGLEQRFANLHLIGRNGMHKYNNQDHAMMTGLLAARNIMAGHTLYDLWQVNQDAEYHESGSAGQGQIEERLVPQRAAS